MEGDTTILFIKVWIYLFIYIHLHRSNNTFNRQIKVQKDCSDFQSKGSGVKLY